MTTREIDRGVLTAYLDETLEAGRYKDYGPNGLQVEGRAQIGHLVSGVTASRALIEAAIEARKIQREANKSLDDKALESLKKRGMVVSDLSKQEREKFVEKVKSVYDKNLATYDKEGPNLVFEALKKYRGS